MKVEPGSYRESMALLRHWVFRALDSAWASALAMSSLSVRFSVLAAFSFSKMAAASSLTWLLSRSFVIWE